MKVIILAAGTGKRLGESARCLPKCLLEIDGRSLLLRHISLLKEAGLEDIHVVTGFQQAAIVRELAEFNLDKQSIYNPDYRLGSVLSLHSARRILLCGEEIILMDADVLYERRILQRLLKSKHANCFLLDRDFEPGEEPVKLCVYNGQLIDFRKKIDKNLRYDFQGESVGFFRFSADMATKLLARLEHYLDEKRLQAPYEEAIRDLLLAEPEAFCYEDISGLAWVEIDFPADLARARAEILNKIKAAKN